MSRLSRWFKYPPQRGVVRAPPLICCRCHPTSGGLFSNQQALLDHLCLVHHSEPGIDAEKHDVMNLKFKNWTGLVDSRYKKRIFQPVAKFLNERVTSENDLKSFISYVTNYCNSTCLLRESPPPPSPYETAPDPCAERPRKRKRISSGADGNSEGVLVVVKPSLSTGGGVIDGLTLCDTSSDDGVPLSPVGRASFYPGSSAIRYDSTFLPPTCDASQCVYDDFIDDSETWIHSYQPQHSSEVWATIRSLTVDRHKDSPLKFLTSVKIRCESTTTLLDLFQSRNESYSSNFGRAHVGHPELQNQQLRRLYNIESEIHSKYWFVFDWIDNDDILMSHSQSHSQELKTKYTYMTARMTYFPQLPSDLVQPNRCFAFFREDWLQSLEYLKSNKKGRTLFELDEAEESAWNGEFCRFIYLLRSLATNREQGERLLSFGDVGSFAAERKIPKTIQPSISMPKTMPELENQFRDYVRLARVLAHPLYNRGSKSDDDIVETMCEMLRENRRQLKVIVGDWILYSSAERMGMPSMFGLMHWELNALRAFGRLAGDKCGYLRQMQLLTTTKRKKIIEVPQGWLKKGLKGFFLYFVGEMNIIWKSFLVMHPEAIRLPVESVRPIFQNYLENAPGEQRSLRRLMLHGAMPMYFFHRAVKTGGNWKLFLASLKKSERLFNQGNSTNYRKVLCAFLFDCQYRWTPAFRNVVAQNFVLRTRDGAFVGQDELGEMQNRKKEGIRGSKRVEAAQGITKMQNISGYAEQVNRRPRSHSRVALQTKKGLGEIFQPGFYRMHLSLPRRSESILGSSQQMSHTIIEDCLCAMLPRAMDSRLVKELGPETVILYGETEVQVGRREQMRQVKMIHTRFGLKPYVPQKNYPLSKLLTCFEKTVEFQ